ncbi:dihydroorotate dehydrogenase electron transfer subunit [Bifidobacterium gallicum]|uniref:2-polyprenylphenol hydroxylase n=1 Tax=Bifidobacterium gallicum DSM 20093 = LMG 11596 TaxID=561180 RepID=D1NSH8_9BIFI|nr:dihydroorotate dehydrogenase electron transfer subunit [Bifidobacterium gallicum]EFA23630.1 oxidoreductase NAD-binding domain protein [Bifidobacterium gallicum DSM 20093 = LMG 11596]KFI58691.1 2-polyprenylphenol hydroxylase [Bifidobacterium gallicum DSM 20093 = LMG 11596]
MATPMFTQTVSQACEAGFVPARRRVPITEVQHLTDGVVRLTFTDAYTAQHAKGAQFVNLFTPDPLHSAPRPFGVSEVNGDQVSVMFAVVGYGTEIFANLQAGDMVDMLGPLGRPFQVKADAHYILVGGGLGVPPLIKTAQDLAARDNVSCTAVFGYRDEHFADAFVDQYADELLSIDESQGNVVTLLDRLEPALSQDSREHIILTCGPLGMMKAVAAWARNRGIACQVSMEQRMGCGYGTCVVCTVDTKDGRKKVCSDGPVFRAEDMGWNE